MPRKLPLYVEKNRVKGKLYFSFRRGKGERIRLPDDPTSTEFLAAYNAALSGEVVKARQTRQPDKTGTIGALIVSYKRSPEYRELRDTTKVGYQSRLEALRVDHGHRTMSGMTREGIITKILAPYADRPGARLSILKMLRVLIRHAIELQWVKFDPSLGIRRPKTEEIRSWTDEEIAQFEARWPNGTKQRLAFALHLYTGQRRSDVHRMTWADVAEGGIRVLQQKTRSKLVIALHHELRATLAQAERQHVTLLNTEYGRPFTVDGFSSWMRDAITKAGLPLECQPHGLRKAAGRRLAEAGCTAREIMAVLGHKTLSEAERYTRDADQKKLAAAAVARLEDKARTAKPKPLRSRLGKPSKAKQEQ